MDKVTSLRITKEALALEFNLYLKTWVFHWNIESASFKELHDLFGEEYEYLQGAVDDLAERVRQLGEKVKLPKEEIDGTNISASFMIDSLMLANQAISKKINEEWVGQLEKAKDFGTMDQMIKLAQWHDKQAWFLRSYGRV